MADWSYCEYRIAGEPQELDHLFCIMQKVEETKGPWLFKLMTEIYGDENIEARGQWSDLKRDEDCISFTFEGAGRTYIEEWDEVCDNFESLCPYFEGVLWAYKLAQKRENKENGWFTDKYYLDMRYAEDKDDETGSFRTLKDVYKRIGEQTGTKVTSEEDVDALRAVLKEENDDTFIHIYEIEEIPSITDMRNMCEPAKLREIDRLVSLLKAPQVKKLIKSRCSKNRCKIQAFQHVSIGEHKLPPMEIWIALEKLDHDDIKRLIHSIEEKIKHD